MNNLHLFIALAAMFTAGCSPDSREAILGEWKLEGEDVIYRFDKKYMQIEEVANKSATTFKYEFLSNDTIRAYYSYLPDPRLKFLLENNDLPKSQIQNLLDDLQISWDELEEFKKIGLVENWLYIIKISSGQIIFKDLSTEDTLKLLRTEGDIVIDPKLNEKLQNELREEKLKNIKNIYDN